MYFELTFAISSPLTGMQSCGTLTEDYIHCQAGVDTEHEITKGTQRYRYRGVLKKTLESIHQTGKIACGKQDLVVTIGANQQNMSKIVRRFGICRRGVGSVR